MKRILTSALILVLGFSAAQAQTTTEKSKADRKEHKRDFTKKRGGFEKLNLTADQQSKLKAVNEDFRKKNEDLRKQDQLTVAEMKTRREALHKEHRTQLQSILTKEQQEQLTKAKKDGKGKTARFEGKKKVSGEKDAKAGRRGAEMGKELGLTEDQKAKMAAIRTDFRSKLETVRTDKALSSEQKRTKIQELSKTQKEQIKTILTKEQVEKMQSARKERPARTSKK